MMTGRTKLSKPMARPSSILKVFAALAIFIYPLHANGDESNFKALRVAHGGGGIQGKTYTNSIDALDHNLRRGFLYFELDFSLTRDGQPVCIHDWKRSFYKRFGYKASEIPDLTSFNALLKKKAGFENCTIESLASWLSGHPEATIITDVKDSNLQVLKIIIKKIPDAANRVIPQIYGPQNYATVKALGYKKIIWTLYRFRGDNKAVLKWLESFNGPFAITMPKERAKTGLPEKMSKKNIPTYVHTVNDASEAGMFMVETGVTEIYTDFLASQ